MSLSFSSITQSFEELDWYRNVDTSMQQTNEPVQ